jgi:hypothetical protein
MNPIEKSSRQAGSGAATEQPCPMNGLLST